MQCLACEWVIYIGIASQSGIRLQIGADICVYPQALL